MSAHRHKQKKRGGPGRALLRLHRRVGVALSAIFILICITGILLNHSDDLHFQKRTLQADWVYDWYGLKPATDLLHFPLSTQSLSSLDGQLYLDKSSLGHFPKPIGVAELEELIAIAFESSILLLTRDGEIIETLQDAAIPGEQITKIAASANRTLTIDTNTGRYTSDENILAWIPTSTQETPAILPAPASPELQKALLQSFRGEGITWGRILLDIHTGRFFGALGKWIADLSAIALILLTVTGVFYTMKYLKKARDRANAP